MMCGVVNIRIMMINYSDIASAGGVHTTIREIASNLVTRGHDVTILQGSCLDGPSNDAEYVFKKIRIQSWAGERLYGLSSGLPVYLTKHYNDLSPDVIHVHGYHTLFSPEAIFIIRKILKRDVPIVFSPHYGINSHSTIAGRLFWCPYNFFIGRELFNNVNLVVAASNYEAENIRKIVDNAKILVVNHGVPVVDPIIKPKSETINLIYAGHLLEIKGVHYIIMALSELISSGVNAHLTIIGEGSLKDYLCKLAIALEVNYYITWKDFMPGEELRQEIKNANVSLLLSKSENYGIVVAESIAVGTPVVVTKIAALDEFLDLPGCYGVSCPPNAKEVAGAILKAWNNSGCIGTLSDKIQTWASVSKVYEKVYYDLIHQ
jgi:glycosyltransferase involved in cell wall biosynthesis